MTSHNHPGKNTLAVALAIVVTAPAAAAAKERPHGGAPATSSQPAAQIIRVSSRGFDWGDAGIGAAAGIGLSMLAVGGLLLTGARRPRGTTAGEAIGPLAGPLLTPAPAGDARVPNDEQERGSSQPRSKRSPPPAERQRP